MQNPIVDKIMKEGIKSVNLSMLPENSRKIILQDVGEKLLKEGKYMESSEVLSLAGDFTKLNEIGDSMSSEGRTETAALFYLKGKDKDKLNSIAAKLVASRSYKLASQAYEASGNMQMAEFLKSNF